MNPVAISTSLSIDPLSDEALPPLKAFDIGADDYVVKPFSIKVLLKRMEVVLKRKSNENVLCAGRLSCIRIENRFL